MLGVLFTFKFSWYGGYQRKGGRGVKHNGGQLYVDERTFDFGWWALNAIYR